MNAPVTALAPPRTARTWEGPVRAMPSAEVASAPSRSSSRRAPRKVPLKVDRRSAAERFPHLVVVEIATGCRVYALRPGDAYTTREEVEVHGRLVGWVDSHAGNELPLGLKTVDLASLPRARRAPAPPPLAICVVAWTSLTAAMRQTVRVYSDVEKRPGLMQLGALSPNARALLERLLATEGLTELEETATAAVWGSP